MLAPSPRCPGIEYRAAYGFTMFDCAPLRATIQPAACADNWTNRKCLACLGCPIGAVHAGKTAPPPPGKDRRDLSLSIRRSVSLNNCIARSCVRCGKTSPRLIGHAFCPTCWNRTLEVIHGRNGKGMWPRVTASILHQCNALFAAPVFKNPEPNQAVKITRYSGAYWLSGLLTDAAELSRLLDRIAPGAVLIDAEFLAVRES